MNSARTIFNQLQKKFSQNQNQLNATIQEAYLKNIMPFWGITKPIVKKLSIEIFKKYTPESNLDYRETLVYFFDNAKFREEYYAGLIYASKFKIYIKEENIDIYLNIILLAQWWDVVDEVAVNLIGQAIKNSKNKNKYLLSWIKHDNLWIRRTALISQLKYKSDTDFDLLTKLINYVIGQKEFFIRKAIGWSLRQYAKTNPEIVRVWVLENQDNLSYLSKKEALKYIEF